MYKNVYIVLFVGCYL